jgi:hypothetical protein
MTLLRYTIVGGGVLVVLGGAVVLASLRPSDDVRPRTVAKAKRDSAHTERVVVERRLIIPASGDLDDRQKKPGDERPQVDRQSERQHLSEEEQTVLLENRFQSDGHETPQTRQLRDEITLAFAQPRARGANLLNAECTATMCRATVVFDSLVADQRVTREIFLSGGGFGGRGFIIPVRETMDDGKIHATAYVFEREPEPETG